MKWKRFYHMTVQRIDHRCACHLSLFSSFSRTLYSSFSLLLRTITVEYVHTIALHCGTSSMSETAPVPSLLLAPESAFPASLSHRGYRHHCVGDAPC